MDGPQDLHQAHPRHRGLRHRRARVRAVPRGDAVREAPERPGGRGRRRSPRPRRGFPDGPLPAAPRLEHAGHAPQPGEPGRPSRARPRAGPGPRADRPAGPARPRRARGDGGSRPRTAGAAARCHHPRRKRRDGA